MYSIERKAEIIKFLEQDGTIEVSAMADYFDTSKETIRRDLKDLEAQGILTRTHGGAVSTHIKNRANDGIQEYPVAIRGIQNYASKQDICKYAVSFIEDGDTIFVDNSSTSMYLVQFLPAELHVTFITNSLKFLAEASKFDCSNKLFICLGGVFNPSNLSTYDTASLLSGNEYYPDKCFISCAGISQERMFTDTSIHEISTKKYMIDAAKEVFLLADHTKFDTNGQFFLADFNSVNCIITDSEADRESLEFLENAGIKICSAGK